MRYFSNVQFRTTQMSKFYSIINSIYQAKEAKSKSKLQHYLILISVLSLFLVLLFIYVYQQIHKLYRIKEELSRTNGRLMYSTTNCIRKHAAHRFGTSSRNST